MFEFLVHVGLWKVDIVAGISKSQHNNDSQEQELAAVGQEAESNTQVKPADEIERKDNRDDVQEKQQPLQPQDDSRKENTDNTKIQNEKEQVEEHAAPSDVSVMSVCQLVMVLYGDQGKTQPLLLGDNEYISEMKYELGIGGRFIVSYRCKVSVSIGA